MANTAASDCMTIARRLATAADALRFTTPSHVYNPLDYAWKAHCRYLQRFGARRGRVLLLGMNPGPWGMAQTGVPFGEVGMTRQWLQIDEPLTPPLPEQHRKYPITGFACARSESTGKRFWGWAGERFGSAERFFEQFFVWNYCPLLFLAHNRNLVPGKLGKAELEPLEQACDRALADLLQAIQPRAVIGIGRYAEVRARKVVEGRLPVDYLHHPSPANPAANRDWPAMADAALTPWMSCVAGSR